MRALSSSRKALGDRYSGEARAAATAKPPRTVSSTL
jgi:hypothetical protein